MSQLWKQTSTNPSANNATTNLLLGGDAPFALYSSPPAAHPHICWLRAGTIGPGASTKLERPRPPVLLPLAADLITVCILAAHLQLGPPACYKPCRQATQACVNLKNPLPLNKADFRPAGFYHRGGTPAWFGHTCPTFQAEHGLHPRNPAHCIMLLAAHLQHPLGPPASDGSAHLQIQLWPTGPPQLPTLYFQVCTLHQRTSNPGSQGSPTPETTLCRELFLYDEKHTASWNSKLWCY
jgi:hypothetical protein